MGVLFCWLALKTSPWPADKRTEFPRVDRTWPKAPTSGPRGHHYRDEVEGDLDDDERDAVRDAASDLEDALEGEEHGIDAVLDAMQDRIARFKGDHPTLTEAVRRVINQPSDMGI